MAAFGVEVAIRLCVGAVESLLPMLSVVARVFDALTLLLIAIRSVVGCDLALRALGRLCIEACSALGFHLLALALGQRVLDCETVQHLLPAFHFALHQKIADRAAGCGPWRCVAVRRDQSTQSSTLSAPMPIFFHVRDRT
jgi:hypothetical protein